jgi:hypothetical protein
MLRDVDPLLRPSEQRGLVYRESEAEGLLR